MVADTKTEQIDLVGVHFNIDTTVMVLANNDTPFVDQGLFANVFTNTSTDNGDGTRSVDLDLFAGAVGGAGVSLSDQTIATFTATIQANDSSNSVTKTVSFTSATTMNKDGVPRAIAVTSPAISIIHNPLGRVQGRIPLQSRTNNAATISLELRELGKFESYRSSDHCIR